MISINPSRTRNYPEEISIIGIHNDETFTTKSDTNFTTLHLIRLQIVKIKDTNCNTYPINSF